MYEFTAVEWFKITGRGDVAAIREKWAGTGGEWTPASLKNKTVKIDGKEYVVKGVEMFMVYASPSQPYHSNFALLVGTR